MMGMVDKARAAQRRNVLGAVMRVIGKWQRPGHVRLHAGEMGAAEMRTVQAVLAGLRAEVEQLSEDTERPPLSPPAASWLDAERHAD